MYVLLKNTAFTKYLYGPLYYNPPTCIQLLLNAAVIAALRKNFFIVTETIIRLLLLPFWQINKKNIVYSKRILGLVGAGKITFTVYVKMYRGNQNFITSESKRFRKAARHRSAESSEPRKPKVAKMKDQP